MSLSDIRNNGLNPLSYLGVQSYSPANFIKRTDDPTSNDSQNFTLGTIWLNYAASPQKVWILVSLSAGVATWVEFATGSGTMLMLTGNTGGAVSPLAGNINVVGDGTTITIAGNPGTHTLTASAIGTGLVQSLTGNSGGAVFPTAGNTNIKGDAVNLTIVGNPGTSTLTASIINTTNHSLQLGNAAGGLSNLGVATNGQLPIGSAGADPVLATLTAGTGITITNGAGSITIAAAGSDAQSFPTDSGTAIPSAGVLNIKAGTSTQNSGSSVSFSGSGNTVTFNASDSLLNTIIGSAAGNSTISGGQNTCLGHLTGAALTSGNHNTLAGSACGDAITTGATNAGYGAQCMTNLTTGSFNVSMGGLGNVTTGSNNTSIGFASMQTLLTGSNNIGLGSGAGGWTGAESNNICIGNNAGVIGESNTMRLGLSTGGGASQINKTFVMGVRGITTVNADAIAVLIDSAGQLGTVSSSERYKDNIEDMEQMSSLIMDLRPVTFNYKSDKTQATQYGLIAEEVAEVFDDIVVYDQEGQPESIQYHILPVLLLNELQKLSKDLEELREELAEYKSNKKTRRRNGRE